MEYLSDLIKILVPAALVLYAMFLVVKSYLQKAFEQQLIANKSKNDQTVLPLRLQAYERMTLFVERISPNNMLLRLSDPDMPAPVFQQQLLKEIRDEFHHNLSQQIYLSDEAWDRIRGTMNEVISLIQEASVQIGPDKNSIDLSEAIFKLMMQREQDVISQTLKFLKHEVRQIM